MEETFTGTFFLRLPVFSWEPLAPAVFCGLDSFPSDSKLVVMDLVISKRSSRLPKPEVR
jgi:hypothetical protein